MEKDSRSRFHQPQHHPPSPNLNLFGFPFDIGRLNTEPICRNPYLVNDSTFITVPSFPILGLQQLKSSEPNGSCNWFNYMPHSHQSFIPVLNSIPKEKFPSFPIDLGEKGSPAIGTAPAQKRFIVFDQSGDKTTLIYSSGVETVDKHGPCLVAKPRNLCKEGPMDSIYYDEHVEDNLRNVIEDEMHEDTEELNALLYSDSDSYFSEDEETSTGHSPSTMTDNGVRDLVEETGEEVDSFAGPTKRQKLLDGGYNIPSHKPTTEDDAESSYGNNNKLSMENLGSSLSCGKRSRKERIRETVSILQSIIPSVNGKDDAIVVINEAIHYLRSLKAKAKALGLDTD